MLQVEAAMSIIDHWADVSPHPADTWRNDNAWNCVSRNLTRTMALNDETLRFPIEEIIVAQDIDYRSFIPNCIFPERVDPPPAPFE